MQYFKTTINATGWIFSSKTGRAMWAPQAIDAVIRATGNPRTPLPRPIGSLDTASPLIRCENLVKKLTGAEAALITSSNSGATTLIFNEFAHGKEAILSRGEFIEVSSRFNIQDIAHVAGTNLVEVGSTNRCRISDYRRQITEETALILKMQRLNYRVEGETNSIGPEQLVNLAAKENARRKKTLKDHVDEKPFRVLVYANQGTGILSPTSAFGDLNELSVKDYLDAGCDLVSCSCDLMLGGPRAGIIAGSKRAISSLVRNPLSYVLKPSKAATAALERTLELLSHGGGEALSIPTVKMFTLPIDVLRARAEQFVVLAQNTLGQHHANLRTIRASVAIGDDILPLYKLDSYLVLVEPLDGDCEKLQNYLQNDTNPHIVTQIKQNCVSFDMRTLEEDDPEIIVQALANYFKK